MEIHTIVEKLTMSNEKRLIFIEGEHGVGKSAIINQAILILY